MTLCPAYLVPEADSGEDEAGGEEGEAGVEEDVPGPPARRGGPGRHCTLAERQSDQLGGLGRTHQPAAGSGPRPRAQLPDPLSSQRNLQAVIQNFRPADCLFCVTSVVC